MPSGYEADHVGNAYTYQNVIPVSTGASGKGTWLPHCSPADTGQSETSGWLLIRFQHCPAVHAIGTKLPQDLYCHLHSHLDLRHCYTRQQCTHSVQSEQSDLSQLSHKWPPAEHGWKHSTQQAAAIQDCVRAIVTRLVREQASGVSEWGGGGG